MCHRRVRPVSSSASDASRRNRTNRHSRDRKNVSRLRSRIFSPPNLPHSGHRHGCEGLRISDLDGTAAKLQHLSHLELLQRASRRLPISARHVGEELMTYRRLATGAPRDAQNGRRDPGLYRTVGELLQPIACRVQSVSHGGQEADR